jgi:hypothetical protein
MYTNWLVMSLCQICRSLSRQERCPGCTTRRWICFATHKQTALQWIPGHCQIAGNEHADALAKKGAKITQTHVRETSYRSIKLHLKQVFQGVYRYELETKLSQKNMEARNNQNTRLAEKKGSRRISIVLWAWLLGYTHAPYWNPPRPLCYATSTNPWTETI